MNISIRRQGVPIRSVATTGQRVRIGSGDDCEVQLNDPFLASLVAEIVWRNDEWWLVDSGTSLEGVTRGGVRVIDEPVEPGQTYVVGGFELVSDANPTRKTVSQSLPDELPKTIVGAALGAIPGTIVQPMPIPRKPPAQPAPPAAGASKLHFEPIAQGRTAPAPAVSPAHVSGTKKRGPILIVAAVALLAIVGGLAVIMTTGGSKPVSPSSASATAAATAAPSTAPQSTTSVPAPATADGSLFARNLEVEKALAAWEASIAAGNADPQVRQKIASGAFEIARAYAAASDSANARRNFQRVVQYGQPGSPEVAYAKSRLGS